MAPLMCTQNTLLHIDYGTPLVSTRSTDYRTSTGKNHGLMPSVGQYFDCRVKTKIKPELLEKDIAVRNEFKSTYTKEYEEKHTVDNNALKCSDRAVSCNSVSYTKSVQEKIFMNPPPPKPPKISEMKESYGFNYWKPRRDHFISYKCEMPEAYRAVQPSIHPEEKSYYKLLDIYMTENKSKFVPYSAEQLATAQEDLITIYNADGTHKGLKEELPGKLHGYKNMYDKRIFRIEYPNRLISNTPKRVPCSGMSSEYRTNYDKPAHSDFYPYLQGNGIYLPESLSGPGPWQNLCAPAMYCSENCHIGTGWSVRAVVDANSATQKKPLARSEPCCTKI